MTITETYTRPSTGGTDAPELIHIVCMCEPDIALCGWDCTDRPWTDDDAECVVCDSLDPFPCPRCGESPE